MHESSIPPMEVVPSPPSLVPCNMTYSFNTSAETPASLLPAELLLDVFTLCRPSIHLPSSSRTAFAALSNADSQVFEVWLHRVVFLDPQYDPQIVNQDKAPSQHAHYSEWHSLVQIESHVAHFLKAHVPADRWSVAAAGLAPNPSHHIPPGPAVVSKSLVEWLLRRKHDGGSSRIANESDLIAELQRIWFAPTSKSWEVLPDTLLIVSFFIRTSQIDLLHHALGLLRSRFPLLDTSTAPFSLWCHFMLNNHVNLLAHLRAVTGPYLAMTYPTFLCLLALFEWSIPAVETIFRAFSETIDLSTVANLVLDVRPYLFQAMLATFSEFDSPTSCEPSSRVLSVVNWIRAHATTTNFHPNYSPYLSHRIYHNHSLFVDMLTLHDLTPDIPPHPTKSSLGTAVTRWVKKGYSQTVPLALEHNLLLEYDKFELLHFGAMTGDMSLVILLAARCKRDGDFPRMLRRALTFRCPADPDPPQTRTALFNLLIAHADTGGVDFAHATNLLTDHARYLSSRVYALDPVARYSLLDLLSVKWDYTTFLQKHLRDGRAFRYVGVTNTGFWRTLIATCMSYGIAWDSLSLKEVVTVCALQLMVFMAARGMVWRQSSDMRTARATDDEVKVISFLVQLARARLDQSKAAAAGNINRDPKKARTYVWGNAYYSFSQLLPHDCWHTLRNGIITVTSIPPVLPLDPDIHARQCADTILAHNLFLDTMLVLDAQFVYELIPFRDLLGTLRLWKRLDFRKFVPPRNRLPLVLGVLRSAAEAGEVDKVAYILGGLPSTFRTSKGFVLGLRGIMGEDDRARRSLKLGLGASGWGREYEQLLAQVMVLSRQDGDGRRDAEEEAGEQISLFD